MLRTFQGDHLGQTLQAVFGADVRHLERAGPQAVRAGDVDDASPATLVHVRQRAPDQPERGLQHDREDQREPLGVELGDRRDVLDAGVVDHDVHIGRQRVDGVEIGEVADHRRDAGQLGGQRLDAGFVAVHGQHVRAVGHQPRHHRGTDPAGGAGDQRRAAAQHAVATGVRHEN